MTVARLALTVVMSLGLVGSAIGAPLEPEASTAPSLALALEDANALSAAEVQFDDEWSLSLRSAPVAALSLGGDSSAAPLAVSVVPEPATLLLVGAAFGLASRRFRLA